ncbi:MAG: PHP domain-containing protein [Candidatus Pacebacteria bacterium]|nr:PHP domain-containing protein [Candidatus Paceibacterota bacterium]
MKITGVSHIHSLYSYDAKLSLAELKKTFKEQGIQFALMTEHTDKLLQEEAKAFVKECQKLSDKDFVFVPGFEVPYRMSHVLMIGAKEFVAQHADEALLLQWREKASFSVLAHPQLNHFIVDTTMKEVIDGVEVWNSQYDGKYVPRPQALKLLKELQGDKNIFAFAGLDFHRKEHLNGPQMTMEVEKLTESAILKNIQTGTYTLGKNTITIGSNGTISGNPFLLTWKSAISIGFITLSKKINKLLAAHDLSLPKRLKQYIRSKV